MARGACVRTTCVSTHLVPHAGSAIRSLPIVLGFSHTIFFQGSASRSNASLARRMAAGIVV